MKIYRSSREVLDEVERALAPKTLAPGSALPLEQIAGALRRGRHYVATGIYLVTGERVLLLASGGPECSSPQVDLGEGVVGKVAQSGKPRLVPDVSGEADYLKCYADTRSELAVPIKMPGRVLGVLNLESAEVNGIGREEQVLAKEVAARLARFLAGRGKYLVRHARTQKSAAVPDRSGPRNTCGAEGAYTASRATPSRAADPGARRAAAGEKSR